VVSDATVQERWEQYAAMTIPPDAPEVQRTEMRRAFFQGVWTCLCRCGAIGDDEEIGEEEGAAMLEAWVGECRGFARAVLRGEA
jgi:hypothetical protein